MKHVLKWWKQTPQKKYRNTWKKISQEIFLRKAQWIKRTDTFTKSIVTTWEGDIRRAGRVAWVWRQLAGKEPDAKVDTGEPKNTFLTGLEPVVVLTPCYFNETEPPPAEPCLRGRWTFGIWVRKLWSILGRNLSFCEQQCGSASCAGYQPSSLELLGLALIWQPL